MEIVFEKSWMNLTADQMNVLLICDGVPEGFKLNLRDNTTRCSKNWCVKSQISQRVSREDVTHIRMKKSLPVESSVCNGSMIVSELYGSIGSPNYPYDYPPDIACTWILKALPGHQLVVQMEYVNVSKCFDGSCCDFVTLTDLFSSSSLNAKQLCGLHTGLEPVYPSSGTLTVNFTSDSYSIPGANGFRLSYRQEKVVLTSLSGVIRSPNYLGGAVSLYPNNIVISWFIDVPEGYHILVRFADDFHVEGEEGRCVDGLSRGGGLEVGVATYHPVLCGRKAPDMYYTLSNHAWFQLDTDHSGRYRGFDLRYKAERRVFNESDGVITSPLYPERFPTPIYTEYTIQAPLGYRIHLFVNMFDVPSCSKNDLGLCAECSDNGNYLEVSSFGGHLSEDIRNYEGRYASKRFCNGLKPHPNLMSITNGLKIIFSSGSDHTMAGKGFLIRYKFVSNKVQLRTNSPTRVQFAPLGYETLGYAYYEVSVPRGHNLITFNPRVKLDCRRGEYVILGHSLADTANRHFQQLCTDTGKSVSEDLHHFWILPQDKLGGSYWTLIVIVRADFIHSIAALTFYPDNPVKSSSKGLLYGLAAGYLWASYGDVSKGTPYIVMRASPLTCGSIRYRVHASPSCDSDDAVAILRSPYNIPHGEDVRLCNSSGEWVVVDGNQISLVWIPSQGSANLSSVLLEYETIKLPADCTFNKDMCGWIQSEDSYPPVIWRRTSAESIIQASNPLLERELATRNLTMKNSQLSGYYMKVHMDSEYAGEKARMVSPQLSANVSRTLSFSYHMHGSYAGDLNVYTWSPSDGRWRLVWTRSGMSNISWQSAEGVPVSACADYHVVFEVVIPRRSLMLPKPTISDVAVDNIFFCEFPAERIDCDDSVCEANGKCIDDVLLSAANNGVNQECCCDYGYTGVQCQTRRDLCADGNLVCENHGTCLNWQTINETLIPAMCSCVPGYTGRECEEEVDECASYPCLNDARCVDGFNRYHCLCPMHFSGKNCETNYDMCKVQKPCMNGGNCVTLLGRNFRCICPSGFTGRTCEKETNECAHRPCLNNGQCLDKVNDFECSCPPGYGGKRCEININACSEAARKGWCHNGASCMDTVNGFQCLCAEGWRGAACDLQVDDCLSGPCVNNGRCVDLHRDFQCACQEGHYGRRCEHFVDACNHHKCMNGLCRQMGITYICDCVAGYAGDFCESVVNGCEDAPCSEGSTCVMLPEGMFYCQCPPGRAGLSCETKVDHCKDVYTCLNGGSCVSLGRGYRCDCLPGYRGHMCEYETSGCEGRQCLHGVCVDDGHNSFECRCADGWTGNHCETSSHSSACERLSPCGEHGSCISLFHDYICVCMTGYTGMHCNVNVDECHNSACSHNGRCVDGVNSFTCDCRLGYRGRYCEEIINHCEYLHCYNGDCVTNRHGLVSCQCYAGYTGFDCRQTMDNCASFPCHPSAVCLNLVTDYYCQCEPSLPLHGKNCDTPINVCEARPCHNGGTCKSEGFAYSCKCPPNTKGYDCDSFTNPCSMNPCRHGACIDLDNDRYECACDPGWTSRHCDEKKSVCSPYVCDNGGSCYVDAEGIAFCKCPKTYTGARCKKPVDPCTGRVCYNGGSCVIGSRGDLAGIAYCKCIHSFGGYSCEVDLSTGAVVNARRSRREISTEFKGFGRNSSNLQTKAEICHPLGNNTSPTTKWIIAAVTIGLYLVVLLCAVVYTILARRLDRSYWKGDYNNNRYYTPPRYDPHKYNLTPAWGRSYFSPNHL